MPDQPMRPHAPQAQPAAGRPHLPTRRHALHCGLAAAAWMQAVDISTTNFQTFSEIAFQFRLTPTIAGQTLLFALAMGFVGGFIPAWRAARMKIVDGLRAS